MTKPLMVTTIQIIAQRTSVLVYDIMQWYALCARYLEIEDSVRRKWWKKNWDVEVHNLNTDYSFSTI